jgi:hypothetical protein
LTSLYLFLDSWASSNKINVSTLILFQFFRL